MKNILCAGLILLSVIMLSMGVQDVCAADSGLKATIISIEGNDVKVDPKGDGAWVAADTDMELAQGAKLKTGTGSSANLVFDKAMMNVLNVEEKTTIAVDALSASLIRVDLTDGAVFAKLKALKGSTFEVKTPVAICGARGSALKVVFALQAISLSVLEDTIAFTPVKFPDTAVAVPPGFQIAMLLSDTFVPRYTGLTLAELAALNAQSAAVDVAVRTALGNEIRVGPQSESEQETTQPVRPEGSNYGSVS